MSKPKKLNFNDAQGAGRVKLDELVIQPRIRDRVGDNRDTLEYIENKLAIDIAEHGVQQPILVKKLSDGRLELVAGFCRISACRYLGREDIPYNLTTGDLTPADQRSLELSENLFRLNMKWQDKVMAIYEIHTIKAREAAKDLKSWGKKETGDLVGRNAAHVGDAVLIAELMIKGDKQVLEANSFDAAMKIVEKRWEDQASTELLKRQQNLPKKTKKKVSIDQPAAFLANGLTSTGEDAKMIAVDNKGNRTLVVSTPVNGQPLAVINEKKAAVEIDLSEKLHNGCCLEWFKAAESDQFDLCYTDIPFAIEMVNLEEQAGIEVIRASHGVNENISQMFPFLKGVAKVVKDKGYLIFWYDIKHQEKLCGYHTWKEDSDGNPIEDTITFHPGWIERAGFEFQPYPNLWLKPSMKSKAAHCYWPKAHETLMVCRKGKATLRELQVINYKLADGGVERRMQNNKFAKPFDISEWILKQISIPGQRMLDCYAGGGSLLRAAAIMHLDVFGIEKDVLQFPDLVETMKKVYNQIYHNNVIFS